MREGGEKRVRCEELEMEELEGIVNIAINSVNTGMNASIMFKTLKIIINYRVFEGTFDFQRLKNNNWEVNFQ